VPNLPTLRDNVFLWVSKIWSIYIGILGGHIEKKPDQKVPQYILSPFATITKDLFNKLLSSLPLFFIEKL
jgi:hypothetical protein